SARACRCRKSGRLRPTREIPPTVNSSRRDGESQSLPGLSWIKSMVPILRSGSAAEVPSSLCRHAAVSNNDCLTYLAQYPAATETGTESDIPPHPPQLHYIGLDTERRAQTNCGTRCAVCC